MRTDVVEEDEILYRGVIPAFMDQGVPSSQVWRDSKGASVDRDAQRTEPDCIEFLISHTPPLEAVVRIRCGDCTTAGASVSPSPVEGNPFHAHVHEPGASAVSNKGVARKLKRAAITVWRKAA